MIRKAALSGILVAVALLSAAAGQLYPPSPFPIAIGGTNATTPTAAFDNLSPLTAKGDLLYFDGTHNVRLAAGTTGQVVTQQANGIVGWQNAPSFVVGFSAGGAAGWGPAASTPYVFANYGLGGNVTQYTMAAIDNFSFTIPVTCTLRAAYFAGYVGGTLASAQTFSGVLRINKATEVTIFNNTLSLAAVYNTATATGLSQAFNAGDLILFKMTTPAWTTAPTAVFPQVSWYFTQP